MPNDPNTPSLPAPSRKITAGLLGGAIASIAMWVLQATTGVQPPPGIEASVATVCSFVAGYFVKD